jgi:hypothetical protein
MKTLGDCVAEMNRVFGDRYNRANVIALWPTTHLRKFSTTELDKLSHLTRETMLYETDRNSKAMMQRLLGRIMEAQE